MTTRDVVRAYHEARFRGDVPAALAQLATPFSFRSPLLTFTDPAAHLSSLPALLSVTTGVDLLSELYGPTEATLIYDLHTTLPFGTQHTAEHFRLTAGRITTIHLLFDATPWQPLLTAMGAPPATT